jgi:hypothetical protein
MPQFVCLISSVAAGYKPRMSIEQFAEMKLNQSSQSADDSGGEV